MSDLQELRLQAAQQASTGNYWAGKAVALIDAIEGCACPAPYDECTHDEPLLRQVERLQVALGEAEGELTLAAQSIGAPDWSTACRLMAAYVANPGQLRADILHAANWLREPGVSGAEVWPWLLARAGITQADLDTVEGE